MTKISVVIPAYENIELFKNCISSVLKQRGVNFTLIVSDDSKSDIIKNYIDSIDNSNVSYFKHDNNSGNAAENWNHGVSKSSSEWLVILHHDEEFIDEYYLCRAVLKLENEGYDLVVSDIDRAVFTKSLAANIIINIGRWCSIFLPSMILIKNFIGPTSVVVFRREKFVPFDSRLKWIVDQVWLLRMLQVSRATRINTTEIRYNTNPLSITKSVDIALVYNNDVEQLRSSDSFLFILFRIKYMFFKIGF